MLLLAPTTCWKPVKQTPLPPKKTASGAEVRRGGAEMPHGSDIHDAIRRQAVAVRGWRAARNPHPLLLSRRIIFFSPEKSSTGLALPCHCLCMALRNKEESTAYDFSAFRLATTLIGPRTRRTGATRQRVCLPLPTGPKGFGQEIVETTAKIDLPELHAGPKQWWLSSNIRR